MPQSGAVTVIDLMEAGETHVAVSCDRCFRRGRYELARILAEHGNVRLPDFLAQVSADCTRHSSAGAFDRCGAVFVGL